MKKQFFFFFLLVAILFIITQNCSTNQVSSIVDPIPKNAWKMPVDVPDNPSRQDWLEFGWASFIALNWPADNQWPAPGQGGKPDTQLNITDKAAAGKHSVWQSYLEPGQLFLEKGADPGTWDQPLNAAPSKMVDGKHIPILGGFGEEGLYFLDQNPRVGLALYDLATTPNPVIDQNNNYVLLEVRYNQAEFEYFKETRFYDACNQSKALRDTNSVFPYLPTTGSDNLPEWAQQGAVELKISWKILDEQKDIKSRYFTTEAFFLSPGSDTLGPYTLGLVGFHILRNTPQSAKTWYWTTFEHVDNVKIYDKNPPKRPNGQALSPSFNPGPAGEEPTYDFGYDIAGRLDMSKLNDISSKSFGNPVIKPKRLDRGMGFPEDRKPVNCSRVVAIPGDVKKLNSEYQARLKGTPWEYYEMIDALYPDPAGIYQLLKPDDSKHDPEIYANPPGLINTTMETYLAYKPSDWKLDNCLSCHYDASPRSFKNELRKPNSKQVFSYLYRRALPSRPDTVKRKGPAVLELNQNLHFDCLDIE